MTICQNRYSVPVRLAGRRVARPVGTREIAIWHDGRVVATHKRLAGRHGASVQLDHYLDLLARKAHIIETDTSMALSPRTREARR